jgi:hypothetical protein
MGDGGRRMEDGRWETGDGGWGTLRSLIRSAGLTVSEFLDALKK